MAFNSPAQRSREHFHCILCNEIRATEQRSGRKPWRPWSSWLACQAGLPFYDWLALLVCLILGDQFEQERNLIQSWKHAAEQCHSLIPQLELEQYLANREKVTSIYWARHTGEKTQFLPSYFNPLTQRGLKILCISMTFYPLLSDYLL